MRLLFRMSSRPSCQLANKLILWHPVDAIVRKEKLVRFSVGAVPAVRWWTGVLPRAGSILPEAWVHSHRGRYGGVLVVSGRHSLWSLAGVPRECLERLETFEHLPTPARGRRASDALSHPDCKAAANMSWAGLSAASLRSHLLGRAEASGSLICHDLPEVPVYLRLPAAADGSGGYHDRAGQFQCATGRRFTAGEAWSVFYFSTPNFNPRMTSYLQHLLVMLRYVPAEAPPTSIVDEVFPAAFGMWDLGARVYSLCEVELRQQASATAAPPETNACTMRPTPLPDGALVSRQAVDTASKQ